MVFEVKYIKYTLFVHILLPHRRPHRLHSRELTVEFSQRREGSCSQAKKMLNLAAAFRTAGGCDSMDRSATDRPAKMYPILEWRFACNMPHPTIRFRMGLSNLAQLSTASYGTSFLQFVQRVCPKHPSASFTSFASFASFASFVRASVFQSKDEPGGTEKARIVMAPLWVDLWKGV